MRWRASVCLLLCLLSGALAAQAPDTLTALAAAQVPARDRVVLAQRYFGLGAVPPAPARARPWQTGARKTFLVTDGDQHRVFPVEAVLRGGGEHSWLWVEQGVHIEGARLRNLAQRFDEQVYGPLRALFGSEARPGVDGDPRVHVLFTGGAGARVAGYYASDHSWPAAAVADSNEHEMFFVNLDVTGTAFDVERMAGLLAHEFQHMIQSHQDHNESVWLNEGFSGFAELYTGLPFGTRHEALALLARPQTQLNTWPEQGNTLPHYGAGLLFVTYFHDRYGADALRRLAQHPDNGLRSLDALLAEMNEPGVDAFFADWALANLLQDAQLGDGRYGYRSLAGLRPPVPAARVSEWPFTRSASLAQYGSDYLRLEIPAEAETLDIALELPAQARLAPTATASGRRVWYSNRQDNSDTTLTRGFDLRGLQRATLHFSLWYHLERLWDYGHLLLSADGGRSWELLETAAQTRANPHGNALGPGYTGQSGGWLRERVALDAWAGQEILLRFELLTDDAVTQPGMLLDDVRIPELGYRSDFEKDDGGWQARGWVWSDNLVPQRLWLQVVQQGAAGPQIQRRLVTGAEVWSLPLLPDRTEVTLALSPLAALTTDPARYQLRLALR